MRKRWNLDSSIVYPASHPEQPHSWAKQWNRYACRVSNCSTFKTLVYGIEYEDPTGRSVDPIALDEAYVEPDVVTLDITVVPDTSTPPASSKKAKSSKGVVDVSGEVADDLTASVS